ncbi:endonuclease [Psychromonas marina]|uniref:Endonuclease n=1 Tax=Psychromonas marina TaxID=88364 RepID=A0ABQ6E3Q8_9GAMM|nr:endonuclease [Psychromonas marina]GLS91971.1 endonuclease [Psychromonas marina]
MKIISILMSLSLFSLSALATNETIQSFSKAKKLLETEVYQNNRITLYCGASFDSKKNIHPPEGFHTDKHVKRSKRVEWEHVVPAENFGRTFIEWREGDKQCVTSTGKAYKGRKCANKTNDEYKYMQADMHNLFPAIGAVNAMRSNYNFQMLPQVESGFGSCAMKIDNKKAEPPVEARGRIARTYLYMDDTYARYNMSNSQKQLMNAWDKMYPVSEWECTRAKKIASIQKNKNEIVESRCNDR